MKVHYVLNRATGAAIIDVHSRFVVGWGLSNSLEARASLTVLQEAIEQYDKPEIINSDQGSQFTCKEWVEYLEENNIQISMDGKGRALDNIYIERLWRTVKRDYVYLHPASDSWELYQGLASFFEMYNYEKHHQGISRQILHNCISKRLHQVFLFKEQR